MVRKWWKVRLQALTHTPLARRPSFLHDSLKPWRNGGISWYSIYFSLVHFLRPLQAVSHTLGTGLKAFLRFMKCSDRLPCWRRLSIDSSKTSHQILFRNSRMSSHEPASVLLVVSQLAAEAVAGERFANLRRKPVGHFLPDHQRGLWMTGRDGQPEDPIMVRHWALRIRNRYFELARVHEDNSVVFEANSMDEPLREICQVDMMGYTHYSEEEICQVGMCLCFEQMTKLYTKLLTLLLKKVRKLPKS